MNIFIHDEFDPESTAMLQALYSRSPKSVAVHTQAIGDRGAGAFMEQYYVGYGHKSIGDCGTTTIFMEDVSMLAAKAIQDSRLYNGQEASTRYLDMSKRPFLNPLGTSEGEAIQEDWRQIYTEVIADLANGIARAHPYKEGEDMTTWRKAVKAKAFDIARGFLPAGATTFVSWHTTLSHAHERLRELRHHPLEEVSDLAKAVHADLSAKYLSSFSHTTKPEVEEYMRRTYHPYEAVESDQAAPMSEDAVYMDGRWFDSAAADNGKELWEGRSGVSAFLPREVERWGKFVFRFLLDFGSFRDLQRHRSCLMGMPVLAGARFGSWYREQAHKYCGREVFCKAMETLMASGERLDRAFFGRHGKPADYARQYYIPMGFLVTLNLHCDLRSAVYIARLRSGPSVHPTLQRIARGMAAHIEARFPGIGLADLAPERAFDITRGGHDITKIK